MFSQLYPGPAELGFEPRILGSKVTGGNSGRQVCLVSDSRAALSPTADRMAQWFASDGWKVTLLDLSPYSPPFSKPATYEYRMLGGNFQEANWQSPMQSLCAYHWLKAHKFNLIVFQHGFGAAYFPCTARKLGLAFENTPIVVIPDTPYAYWLETVERLISNVRTEAEIDFLEREAVARADGVLFTNPKALDWMANARWSLGTDADRFAIIGEDEKGESWGEWMAKKATRPAPVPAIPAEDVFITVCVASYNRPDFLRETLKNLLKQTATNFEVIVINTTDKGVGEPYEEFREIFEMRGWRWMRQEKLGLGAAFNYGATFAKGTHLLFKDDDNYSLADEIELFSKAAQSGADVVNCVTGKHHLSENSAHQLAVFPARSATGLKTIGLEWLHFGPVLTNGLMYNTFGDTNSLMKREVFEALGGFNINAVLKEGFLDPLGFPVGKNTATYTYNDWECYSRAALAGYKFESLPEPLFLYRVHSAMFSRDDRFKKVLGVFRSSYARYVPPFMYPVILALMTFVDRETKIPPGRFPDPFLYPEAAQRIGIHKAFRPADVNRFPRVVTAATDRHVKALCAMIASLATSTRNPFELNVISAMSSANNDMLQTIANHYGVHAHILPYHSFSDPRMPVSNCLDAHPSALYWRLLLPEYLPDAKRVIALDCDVLVRHDIAELWNIDLNGNMLAAVIDKKHATFAAFRKRYNGIYFHPGVILADIELWRKHDVAGLGFAALKFLEDEKNLEKLWDQTPLNEVARNRWMRVSPTWNWLDDTHHHDFRTLGIDQREGEQIMSDAAICRFEELPKTSFRPDPHKGHYGNEFNLYLKLVDAALNAIESKRAAA